MDGDLKMSADFILSLPGKVEGMLEQAKQLKREVDEIKQLIWLLDFGKLSALELTGNRKLDAALRLSLESGSLGQNWLEVFPIILAKLENYERQINSWSQGGLLLLDKTPQAGDPACLEMSLWSISPSPTMILAANSSNIRNFPFGIGLPGKLILQAHSNTSPLGVHRLEPRPLFMDLTKLVHPNWGTRNVTLCGLFLGEQAITQHLQDWQEFVNQYIHRIGEKEHLRSFLSELEAAVKDLAAVAA